MRLMFAVISGLMQWWREMLTDYNLGRGDYGCSRLTWLNNQVKRRCIQPSADILIARLLSNIELDNRVSTSVGVSQTDQNGWRASMLQLSRSSACSPTRSMTN